jgi:3-carboxy-cis,cis-muconate cycloisomerase
MRPSSSRSEIGRRAGTVVFAGVFSRGDVAREVSDWAWLQAMLDVEAALSRALCRAGLASAEAARAITEAARADSFDLRELGAASAATGNPVPALVKALAAAVPEEARAAVHLGATSQDVLDTAMMLLTKRAGPIVLSDLAGAADACALLAQRHRGSVMVGRTLLQQAVPITFGLKAAGWLEALGQTRLRLSDVVRHRLPVQFGGAAGTLGSLGARGIDVAHLLAEELDLPEPVLPWHTFRMPIVDLAAALAGVSAVLGKIARDVTLLAQSEVAEVSEPFSPGRGASSAMAHKRNPVGAVAVLGCVRRAPGLLATLVAAAEQEHERAAGAWHAEWETLGDLIRLTGSAAAWIRELLGGLEVDTERMRANLDTARHVLSERHAPTLDPLDSLGSTQAWIDRALAAHEKRRTDDDEGSAREASK